MWKIVGYGAHDVLFNLYVLRCVEGAAPYGFNLYLIESVGANIIRPF